MGKWVMAFLLLFAAMPIYAFDAHDEIVINSKDWKDIYSAMLYASLTGVKASYLIEESRGYLLIDTIQGQSVLLFEGSSPYIKNFDSDLTSKGKNVERVTGYDNLNFVLLEDLDSERVIVVDERYPYNAVSLASFAVLKGYYVVFATADNIASVADALSGVDELIIYGYVDRDVTNALESFNPEIINQGNKYANNLEIVKRFDADFTQFVLTSGSFIEPQFFTPESPVVFIGQSSIPEDTMQFLKDSEVKHAILIGNELHPLGLQLKSEAGMKIMLKFAKGINKVQYSLDTIYLPVFEFRPAIELISYNQLQKQVIVTIRNTGPSPFHARGTFTIFEGDESIIELGDEEPFFVGPNGIVTRTYDADLTGRGDLTVKTLLVYGEDTNALDNLIQDERSLEFVSIDDKSSIELKDVEYDNRIKRFAVSIKNTGDKSVITLPILQEVIVNNKPETLASEPTMIEPGETEKIMIKARLTPEDILDNEQVNVLILYGEKENQLVKSLNKILPFKLKSYTMYIVAGALLVAIIILFFVIRKKRRAH